MRERVRLLLILVLAACTTTAPPVAAPEEPADYGMTVAEEASILSMEDRRHYDPAFVAAWVSHPSPLHRMRIALALGRVGPHTFADANGSGHLDANETRAGITELAVLAKDPDRRVRELVAFSLGEIGDN